MIRSIYIIFLLAVVVAVSTFPTRVEAQRTAFDIQITALAVPVPNRADQESDVQVTFRNGGTERLFAGQYSVRLSVQQNLNGLIRDRCTTQVVAVNPPPLPEIAPGETRIVTVRFRFHQAGDLTLIATAVLGGEDGPTTNNTQSLAVTVPLPLPMICEVEAATINPGDPVTIRGNWFKRLGSSDMPTVTIGGLAATVTEVPSPLEVRASMPNLQCTAVGRVPVTVTNATGARTFQNGPSFPPAPDITGGTGCPGGQVTLTVANLRSGCAPPIVHFVGGPPLPGVAVDLAAGRVTAQLPAAIPASNPALELVTTYGTDRFQVFNTPVITNATVQRTTNKATVTLTLNNFLSNCSFNVTVSPGPPLNFPVPGTITFTSPNNTTIEVVFNNISSNTTFTGTVRVQTGYGTATRDIGFGPFELPRPRLPGT